MEHTTSLTENYEFKRVYARGKSHVASAVVVYCRKNRSNNNRLGITVKVKVGKAVVRNRIRRRLREIYRLNEPRFARGFDIVMVARVCAANCSYSQLQNSVLNSMRALGLVMDNERQ